MKNKQTGGHEGIKHTLLTCPHCDKEGGSNTMKTWHFDRCKFGPNLRPPRRIKVIEDDDDKEEKVMKGYVTKYYVIKEDRSVHPTAYSLLYNAEVALNGSPKMGAPIGSTHPKIACTHCGKLVSTAMMLRWHGDKCKDKI